MKKFLAFLICIMAVILPVLFATGNFAVKKVAAETITTSDLEYFELINPISVCRDETSIYIAENYLAEEEVDGKTITKRKNHVVIYKNDTYEKIDFPDFDIKHIEKCGNFLFILSQKKLYAMNLATKEVKLLSYDNAGTNITFDNVISFSVKGNFFAVNVDNSHIKNDRLILLFEITDSENMLFELVSNAKPNENSQVLALDDENNFYYFDSLEGNLNKLNSNDKSQAPFKNVTFDKKNSIDQLFFDQKIYYKINDNVCSVEKDINSLPKTIVNLKDFGIKDSGDFFIWQNKMLICDPLNKKICEYDIENGQMTGFEISFTKIYIPDDFVLTLDETPQKIDVASGTKLYDINLDKSLDSKYFIFNGYHSQKANDEYIVIGEIDNLYYVIAGECIALVMKENFTPVAIEKTEINKEKFVTTNAHVYIMPYLKENFLSSPLEKHCKVNVIWQINFRDINYCLVEFDDNKGYLPSTFLIDYIYSEPVKNTFKTATVLHRGCEVFGDKGFENKVDDLEGFTQVIVIEESENYYLVNYQDDKTGYVKKSSIVKKGSYTNKIVAVVVLCALAMLVTGIYLELKYLYSKKKLSTGKRKNKTQ